MEEIRYIKLSDLSRRIEQVFRQNFANDFYWIIAEVSGHKFYRDTDRHYFDLVEKSTGSEVEVAKFKAKSWSEGSASIENFEQQTGQSFQSGIQVLIKVKVEYHSLYGLSLTLVEIDPSFTLGNIERQRRETLQRLVSENKGYIELIGSEYHTKNKSLDLPIVIQQIALIASPNSEGYADFIHTLTNNQYQYKFLVDNYFSSVQGKDAEKELINTLISIYKSEKKYDCVVMIRGGGAKTDFLVFDTYHLSRAVARFPIPVITGIGHHKDVSIVDMMAHSPTKTPTKCAELIISHNKFFEESVMELQNSVLIKSQQLLSKSLSETHELQGNIIVNVQYLLKEHADELNNRNRELVNNTKDFLNTQHSNLVSDTMVFLSKPKLILQRKEQALLYSQQNICSLTPKFMLSKSTEMNHYVKVMKLMSPVNIMKKGFAIISMDDEVLINGDKLKNGSIIKINMHQTELDAEITNKTKNDGKKYDI